MVAEKDPALLRETFARFDFSDLLSNDRLLLGTGEPENHFFYPYPRCSTNWRCRY